MCDSIENDSINCNRNDVGEFVTTNVLPSQGNIIERDNDFIYDDDIDDV